MSDFHVHQARAVYCPRGNANAYQLADMITNALQRAYGEGAVAVLVNVRAMTGFESPGAAYRRWAVRRWSATVRNKLCVAMVAQRQHISPEKVGLLVAAEEGLDASIFEQECDAIAWLDACAAGATVRPGGSETHPRKDEP